MPRIAVLGIDGAQLASLATFLDVFDLVNRYGAQQYADREVLPATLEVRVLSPTGRALATQCGRIFPVDDSISALGPPFDLVYAAGFEIGSALDLAARLQELEPVVGWLKRQREAGAVVAASGAGVLLLAEAGLLQGLVATVPWWLERAFRRRYPDIELDISRVIAEVDDVFCAGAMRGEAALAHRLVERIASPNVANWLAKITLVDPYPDGPAPWTVFSPQVLREDGLVGRAQHWLQLRFSQKPRLRDLADALAVSERTLVRRFGRSLGMTPLEYLQLLRIEAAKQMLARSSRRIDRIGYLVGYSDPGFFKKIFAERTGMSPSEYRRRHSAPNPSNPPPNY